MEEDGGKQRMCEDRHAVTQHAAECTKRKTFSTETEGERKREREREKQYKSEIIDFKYLNSPINR